MGMLRAELVGASVYANKARAVWPSACKNNIS